MIIVNLPFVWQSWFVLEQLKQATVVPLPHFVMKGYITSCLDTEMNSKCTVLRSQGVISAKI